MKRQRRGDDLPLTFCYLLLIRERGRIDLSVSNLPSAYFTMISLPKSGRPKFLASPIFATVWPWAVLIVPVTGYPSWTFICTLKLEGEWVRFKALLAISASLPTNLRLTTKAPVNFYSPWFKVTSIRIFCEVEFKAMDTFNRLPTVGLPFPLKLKVSLTCSDGLSAPNPS